MLRVAAEESFFSVV